MKLSKTERNAKWRLERMGWKPKKKSNTQVFDFECTDHRYVEVKRILAHTFVFQPSQINGLFNLKNNEKLYIMVYDECEDYYGMLELRMIERNCHRNKVERVCKKDEVRGMSHKYSFYVTDKKLIKKLDALQKNKILSDIIEQVLLADLDKQIKRKMKQLDK